jgi:hypothetical protein
VVILGSAGELIEGSRLPTTHTSFQRKFSSLPRSRVAMEVGADRRWGPFWRRLLASPSRFEATTERSKGSAASASPETKPLCGISGVGRLTALAFVLTPEDPLRFRKSREVGAALGLVPRADQSGDRDPQLRITKTGDAYVRRLLVGSAQYMLWPFGADCDLRRWGLRLAERGGKNAKKRAVVGLVRKLAILLHH